MRGLDIHDHAYTFGAVEILKGLKSYGKSIMSRKVLELEAYTTKLCPYKIYISETSHRSVAFKYDTLVRLP